MKTIDVKNLKKGKAFIFIVSGLILLLVAGILIVTEVLNNTQEQSIADMENAIRNQSFTELAECVDIESAESLMLADQIYSQVGNIDLKEAFLSELNLEENRAKSFQVIQRKAVERGDVTKMVPSLIITNDGSKCQVSYLEIELVNEDDVYYVLLK